MKAIAMLGAIVLLFALAQTGQAAVNDGILKYFNDTAVKVKATEDPVQKREILDKSLHNMTMVLGKVQGLPLVPKDDQVGLVSLITSLQERQDELAGKNGLERVSDAQLNDFSDYIVQDMQQAPNTTITISVVTALLIIIILILLL
jgi:hypothetical protein